MEEKHTLVAYRVLRIAYGVVPLVAGLDKFTNLLTDWKMYLSPLAVHVLPVALLGLALAARTGSRALPNGGTEAPPDEAR